MMVSIVYLSVVLLGIFLDTVVQVVIILLFTELRSMFSCHIFS